MHGLVYEFTSTIWHASHANENPSNSSPEFVVAKVVLGLQNRILHVLHHAEE